MPNPIVDQLIAQVTRSTEVNSSAKILIDGIDSRVKAAIAKSLENGATAAELQPLTELSQALASTSNELAAAVAANTPAATEPPVTPPGDPASPIDPATGRPRVKR